MELEAAVQRDGRFHVIEYPSCNLVSIVHRNVDTPNGNHFRFPGSDVRFR